MWAIPTAHSFPIAATVTLQLLGLLSEALLIPNSASQVDSLPSIATVVLCVVAEAAVSAGADAAVGAISGRVVLIAVVANDNTEVVSKQTAGIEWVRECVREWAFV